MNDSLILAGFAARLREKVELNEDVRPPGLGPVFIVVLYAALKRRSTVLRAIVDLDGNNVPRG